jgi:hypothetical protein
MSRWSGCLFVRVKASLPSRLIVIEPPKKHTQRPCAYSKVKHAGLLDYDLAYPPGSCSRPAVTDAAMAGSVIAMITRRWANRTQVGSDGNAGDFDEGRQRWYRDVVQCSHQLTRSDTIS